MALNTSSTGGLLGGHIWKYGTQTGIATFDGIFSTLTEFNAFQCTGDSFEIKGYSYDAGTYITERIILCRSTASGDDPAYAGSTGDLVNIGDNIGQGRTATVQGIACSMPPGEGSKNIVIELAEAFGSSNVQIPQLQAEAVDITASINQLVLTLSNAIQDNTNILYFDAGSSTPLSAPPLLQKLGENTHVGYDGVTAPIKKFSGGQILGPFDNLYDELVLGGKFVNLIAGSNEKSGLTRVNNSTPLDSPQTTSNTSNDTKARILARAYLAYKKKKK